MMEGNTSNVSVRLGHLSTKLTIDTYSHVSPNMQKEAAQKLDNSLFNEQNPFKTALVK